VRKFPDLAQANLSVFFTDQAGLKAIKHVTHCLLINNISGMVSALFLGK